MHNAAGARSWLHAGRAMRIMKRRNVRVMREVVRDIINCACINIVNS